MSMLVTTKKNSLFDIEICFKTEADATQTKMSEHIIRPFEASVTWIYFCIWIWRSV